MTNKDSSCSECRTYSFIGFGLCPSCRTLLAERKWFPLDQTPPKGLLVLIRGRSAVMTHPLLIVTGYYDPEWRPLDPWRTVDGDSFSDSSWVPEEWTPLSKDLLPEISA